MQGTHRSFVHGLAERLRLPAGHGLEPQVFARRHRMLRVLLAGHVPALFAFGLWRGYDAEHLALELTPVVAAICADRLSRRQQWQSLWVTGGLAWCSAT